MSKWLQRFHIVATIGGGFVGLAVGLATLLSNWGELNVLAVGLVLAYCALCIWSVALGVRLVEGANVTPALRSFYILQIPFFTTPAVSFHAGFGVMVYVGTLPSGRNIHLQLGADWSTAILTNEGWSFAVNLAPLIVLWLMRRAANQPLGTDPRVRKLIEDYQAAVARATLELNAGGVLLPDSNVGWSLNAMPERGVLPSGATYVKHGYGCTVQLPEGEIDFDFGDSGEIDGFDAWRLSRYAESRSAIYGPTNHADLDRQLASLRSQGILRKDVQGSLYYLLHEAREAHTLSPVEK